jgi:pimeloyl-ACP methyl ester carboxylesterase
VELVEEWHMNLIGRRLARSVAGRISAATYAGVRRSAELAGGSAESLLGQGDSAAAGPVSSSERDAVLAALNGFIGDRLAASGNPLAIPMRLRCQGQALELDRPSLARDMPQATGKIVVLVHGLCRSDLQWRRNEHDHGEALAQRHGYTPVYLHYNTGRHLSQNGREFARMMEELAAAWPVRVEQITIIGHSMGGLVARSACYYAMQEGHRWQRHLRHLVFLGTPHHGPARTRWPMADGADRPHRAHRPFSHGSRGCAAQALPICATATCWTKTGATATASSKPATTARRSRFPIASTAT